MEGMKDIPEALRDSSLVYYLRVNHADYDADFGDDSPKDIRMEHNQNVIQKNEHVLGYYVSVHGWGADRRDINEMTVYKNLGAIEDAFKENGKLTRAAWPDEDAKDAFFEKYNKLWTGWHADYIYSSQPALAKW